jgi:hypothetical protein
MPATDIIATNRKLAMSKLIITAMCILVVGCTNARISKSFTSGQIGCPVDKIKITHEEASANGIHDWIAECDGRTYACNYIYPTPAKCTEIKAK